MGQAKEKKWYEDWQSSKNMPDGVYILEVADNRVIFTQNDPDFGRLHLLWSIAESALASLSQIDREKR